MQKESFAMCRTPSVSVCIQNTNLEEHHHGREPGEGLPTDKPKRGACTSQRTSLSYRSQGRGLIIGNCDANQKKQT